MVCVWRDISSCGWVRRLSFRVRAASTSEHLVHATPLVLRNFDYLILQVTARYAHERANRVGDGAAGEHGKAAAFSHITIHSSPITTTSISQLCSQLTCGGTALEEVTVVSISVLQVHGTCLRVRCLRVALCCQITR